MNKLTNTLIAFEQFYYLDEQGHLQKPKYNQIDTNASGVDKLLAKIVLVPTKQLLLVEVFVPGKKATDWSRALPFVLEEQLSQPIEQLFFVILNREKTGDKAGYISAAIIEKEKLANWVKELKAHNLEHAELIPDVFAVPFLTDKINSIQLNDNSQLVRTEKYKGICGSSAWVAQVLELDNKNITNNHSASDKIINPAELIKLKKLTLRQKEFAVKINNNSLWKLWLLPITLIILLLITYLASNSIQTKYYATQAQLYQQQTNKLFRQMFPNSIRIVNVKAQTLANLAQNNNLPTTSATQLLTQLEPILLRLIQNNTINIKTMQWQNNQLILTIEAKNIDILQDIVENFSQNHTARLELTQLSNQSSKLVSGDIYVK